MDLSDPIEAKKYIKYQTGVDLKDEDPLKVDRYVKHHYDHVGLANLILKFIHVVPGVHPIGKRVMQMRIMNPGITEMKISLLTGLRTHEYKLYERDALFKITKYIKQMSMQEATDKFNKENSFNDYAVKNENTVKSNPLGIVADKE